MVTACKPQTPEQLHEHELDAQIEAHARKANRIIQKARAKMTPEDRKRADENSSAAAKQARRRAGY
jgi:hypothetical protein